MIPALSSSRTRFLSWTRLIGELTMRSSDHKRSNCSKSRATNARQFSASSVAISFCQVAGSLSLGLSVFIERPQREAELRAERPCALPVKLRGPRGDARSEPRVHNPFQRPRRQSEHRSRFPPTIVRCPIHLSEAATSMFKKRTCAVETSSRTRDISNERTETTLPDVPITDACNTPDLSKRSSKGIA